ncbi:tetratricopeptide repeat protein 12 [Fundulus heteroclitus]|uniref:tetratricopeptide repeat protein 12 n=1 Tax=Fundulus heteroclitus TaxID=8078 RepID=UPI00165C986E|nr:tetratricopeptide repeat protein 12 [Fundulus heteroclitus]
MMENPEDFERFLNNVDTIGQLLEDFQSSDVGVQQKAVSKADSLIAALDEPCRTKVNKTTVNTNPPLQPSLSSQNESQEHFMKIMERDAEDRRIKRMAKLKEATALKGKGNEAYAQQDYEAAVKYYSDGLAVLRDMQPLYTNRAQAYIKLKRYKEAIRDCEWALKCNERCIKAYVHMGKAFLGLKKYNEAKSCFEKIQKFEPRREKMVKEYLDLVDSEEKKDSQERNAKQELDKGERKATVVPQLLEKLSRPGQVPLYYCGGLESLTPAVTDCTGQTLFRLNNGFSIISGNDVLRRCLLQKTDDLLSNELCISVLRLWRTICHDNNENQIILMKCPVARRSLVELLTSGHVEVVRECLELLRLFSKTSHGRRLVVDNLNVQTLVRNLMWCISESKQQQEITAVYVLETFASEEGFRLKLRNMQADCVAVPFQKMLANIGKFNQNVLRSLISSVGFLAEDEVIRQTLAHEQHCWETFLTAIKQCGTSEYKDILYLLLGLIINLSTVTSSTMQEHAVTLSDCCLDLLKNADGEIVTRATGVLSTVLPQSSEAVQHAVRRKVVQTMCWLLKGKCQTATKSAIKTLTVCTAVSDKAREELVNSDKKLSTLRQLLTSSCGEVISGNAALCLAHCFEREGVASHLLGTDIVLGLLRLAAGEAKNTAVQQNAAIALSKLCQSEPRHVEKLRELHGLEILHSCAKLIS